LDSLVAQSARARSAPRLRGSPQAGKAVIRKFSLLVAIEMLEGESGL